MADETKPWEHWEPFRHEFEHEGLRHCRVKRVGHWTWLAGLDQTDIWGLALFSPLRLLITGGEGSLEYEVLLSCIEEGYALPLIPELLFHAPWVRVHDNGRLACEGVSVPAWYERKKLQERQNRDGSLH